MTTKLAERVSQKTATLNTVDKILVRAGWLEETTNEAQAIDGTRYTEKLQKLIKKVDRGGHNVPDELRSLAYIVLAESLAKKAGIPVDVDQDITGVAFDIERTGDYVSATVDPQREKEASGLVSELRDACKNVLASRGRDR